MASNADIEMRWVDAWNAAYDIAGARKDIPCRLPDGSIVTLGECLGWLQASVYRGDMVRVEEGWVGHQRGVVVHTEGPDIEPDVGSGNGRR